MLFVWLCVFVVMCVVGVCVCVCVLRGMLCLAVCVLLRVLRGMLCLELSRSSSRPSPSSPRTSNAEPPLGWTWASPHKMQGGGAQPSQNAGGELINESVCVRLCVCVHIHATEKISETPTPIPSHPAPK